LSDASRESADAHLVPSSGTIDVNGVTIYARDGAAIREVAIVSITAIENADVVMVDVLSDMWMPHGFLTNIEKLSH